MGFQLDTFKTFARIEGSEDDTLINDLSAAAGDMLKGMLGLESSSTLPDSHRVTYAHNLLTLSFYEARSFLSEEVDKAVLKKVNNLISYDRNDAAFSGGVSEN